MTLDKKKASTVETAEEEPLPEITEELAESLTDDVRSPPTSYPSENKVLRPVFFFFSTDGVLWRNYSNDKTMRTS